MEKSKVDMYCGMNVENFKPQDLSIIRQKLEEIDDDKFYLLQGTELQKPSTILVLAIVLGMERFWLDDVALGVLKLITCYGCLIWWFVDIFTAKDRAQKYNFKKVMQNISFA